VNLERRYGVIVVGGGHAGTEAALGASRAGISTLLLTQSIDSLGQLSCNPSIGGIGKGHLVREIDAMGGFMGRAADLSGIHFRTLNASKGPAVRATRAQIDRDLYRGWVRRKLERQAGLDLFQQPVADLLLESGKIVGVVTQAGIEFRAQVVILTVGTFLGGRIHVGDASFSGGRAGDPPSNLLSERLRELALDVGRLKTGTPPRIDGRTIDFSKIEEQRGDLPPPSFSFQGREIKHLEQRPCYITYTNTQTHDLIRSALHRSPMYNGSIESVGPRYCPSIEDKVVRFSERTAHQIFVEPEGLETTEVYPNGISTSLPFDVQLAVVRSIVGFEKAHITRPGYAIEYDYFDPRGVYPWLESREIENLFFAGQINGTTGYEEAASQGLLSGLNAALRVKEKDPWYPRRDEAYLGVLIDDLVTRGTQEPYRMFTSRAEFRLMLREDNADLRLTEKARSLGLISDEHWEEFYQKKKQLEKEHARLSSFRISPSLDADIEMRKVIGKPLRKAQTLMELLKRPEVDYEMLMQIRGVGPGLDDKTVISQLENIARYSGYIERQSLEVENARENENTVIPAEIDYSRVTGLSSEVIQKLAGHRPITLGQAARIAGVTPAAISLLTVHLRKFRSENRVRV
jgi:tRNA uridine 5-carboxymethylaminomethyl modification enzyme